MNITQEKLIDRLGEEHGRLIYKKFISKMGNASRRKIPFNLELDDAVALGPALLGTIPGAVCDYCGLPFDNTAPTGGAHTSLERIDDKLGYVRGNLCVVRVDANQLKDRMWDKVEDQKGVSLTQDQLKVVSGMMKRMSADYLEKLKDKYVPKGETCVEEGTEVARQEGSEEISKPVVRKPIPEDVTIAEKYAGLLRYLSKHGEYDITLTFTQFKMAYQAKKCFVTGKDLDADRLPVIMDHTKPIAYGNVRFANEKAATALNRLVEDTGCSVGDLVANLKRAIK